MKFSNVANVRSENVEKILSMNHLREEFKFGPKSNMSFVSNMDGTYIY